MTLLAPLNDTPGSRLPSIRLRLANQAPIKTDGEFVLYWMIAARRLHYNFALDRAVEWASHLQKPLVVFEPLRVGYRWASDRIHRFIIDGMADNSERLRQQSGVFYYPYVEPSRDADKGLLDALAQRASVVVTDEFPSFFLPRMVSAVASRLPVRLEVVDSNGLLPLRATDRVFTTAFSFRAYLQKALLEHLECFPQQDSLAKIDLPPLRSLLREITSRWPPASQRLLSGDANSLARLPIDHGVSAVEQRGGPVAAKKRLKAFLKRRLIHYSEDANDPDSDARSGLSPYLHFGHISAHELFQELMVREGWTPVKLGTETGGKREGWWGVSRSAEAWLDEFVTWRELGYNMTSHCDGYDRYESLPSWARATLEKHQSDRREFVYSLEDFAEAKTHDELWNAAQRQLLREGRIHNYLRMLWGKKILEWTPKPHDALEVLIELNNRYALDGRNPNSYSGIFWCLGRYDRPWGPERPVFGKVRYMSSTNTARKLKVESYLHRYGS